MAVESVLFSNEHWKEVNPVQCGRERCAPGHAYGPAVRDFYLLHYLVSGKGIFEAGGHTYRLHPGDIFVIHPFERTYYKADDAQPWEYIWVGFTAATPLPAALCGGVLRLPHAHALFEEMFAAGRMRAGRTAYLCGCIWQLFARLQEQADMPKATPEATVQLATSCIEAEYMHGLSVETLARRLHLNRSYFSTLFRTHTGQSPQQYITKYRLAKAAELLREHGYPPGEAALSAGYPDVFSFSKMFKRHYGVSPTEYGKSK